MGKIHKALIEIDGVESLYAREDTPEASRQAKRQLRDFQLRYERKESIEQDLFKFRGLCWRTHVQYFEDIATARTKGIFRVFKNDLDGKIYIRSPEMNKFSDRFKFKLYTDEGNDYNHELLVQDITRVKDYKKSIFDVARFQTAAACDSTNRGIDYYSDMILMLNQERVGKPFQGYYVIAGPQMCYERLFRCLSEYFEERSLNDLTSFLYLDHLCGNTKLFSGVKQQRGLTEFEKQFLKEELLQAVASFDKVLIVLDSWRNPTTLLSTYCIWLIHGLIKYNKDFEVICLKKLPQLSQELLEDLHDRNGVYKLKSYMPGGLTIYPMLYGTGEASSANTERSIYRHLLTEDYRELHEKDVFMAVILWQLFDDNNIDFVTMKEKVLRVVYRKFAVYLSENIVAGILKRFKSRPKLLFLQRLQSCATLLHQLYQTEFAIGLLDYTYRSTNELNHVQGLLEFKCNLAFDKLSFRYEETGSISKKLAQQPINTFVVENYVSDLFKNVDMGTYIAFSNKLQQLFKKSLLHLLNRGEIDLERPQSFMKYLEQEFNNLKNTKVTIYENVKFEAFTEFFANHEGFSPKNPGLLLSMRRDLALIAATPVAEQKEILEIRERILDKVESVDFTSEENIGKEMFLCLALILLFKKLLDADLTDYILEDDLERFVELASDTLTHQQYSLEVELLLIRAKKFLALNQPNECAEMFQNMPEEISTYPIGQASLKRKLIQLKQQCLEMGST